MVLIVEIKILIPKVHIVRRMLTRFVGLNRRLLLQCFYSIFALRCRKQLHVVSIVRARFLYLLRQEIGQLDSLGLFLGMLALQMGSVNL